MKQAIYILTFLTLASCHQSSPEQKTTSLSDSISETSNSEKLHQDKEQQGPVLTGFEHATLYPLTDTITADFNGDGVPDKAICIKDDQASGILIKHGETNEEIRIGFGKPFAHFTAFDWVDYWGLVEDRETYETTLDEEGNVSGSKKVNLQHPSIALGEDGTGGGLITYLNGKYVWIHQTC